MDNICFYRLLLSDVNIYCKSIEKGSFFPFHIFFLFLLNKSNFNQPAQWSTDRVSALKLVGCGFNPHLDHTKDYKVVGLTLIDLIFLELAEFVCFLN